MADVENQAGAGGNSQAAKQKMKSVANILTIDVEEWYAEKIFKGFKPKKDKDYVLESTFPLLDLLEKYNIKATFFVVGTVLQKYPSLIKKIDKQGHEIACHGFSHKPLHWLTPKEFEGEIVEYRKIIYQTTQKYPKGFRAPSCSLTNTTKWALPILKKHGFIYDSSILPLKLGNYGVDSAPQRPYCIDFNDVCKEKDNGLIEFPIHVVRFCGIPFVAVGGFYFRLYPLWLNRWLITTLNKNGVQANVYIHPWELNPKTPIAEMSMAGRFVTYIGIKDSFQKFEKMIKGHQFSKIEDNLEQYLGRKHIKK